MRLGSREVRIDADNLSSLIPWVFTSFLSIAKHVDNFASVHKYSNDVTGDFKVIQRTRRPTWKPAYRKIHRHCKLLIGNRSHDPAQSQPIAVLPT